MTALPRQMDSAALAAGFCGVVGLGTTWMNSGAPRRYTTECMNPAGVPSQRCQSGGSQLVTADVAKP